LGVGTMVSGVRMVVGVEGGVSVLVACCVRRFMETESVEKCLCEGMCYSEEVRAGNVGAQLLDAG